MIPGGDSGEREAGEERVKRKEREESPRSVQGTQACTLAQLPVKCSLTCSEGFESSKSNHITPLYVNTEY